jgi:hypothetical protein
MSNATSRSSRLPLYLLLFVCGLSLILGMVHGASVPFWFDEISTIRIAAMPTWGEAFRGTQTLDLNPPLEVLLVRASSLALGPHELAGHLPSILGFTLAVVCLFVLLERRVSPWFGAFGSLLLIQNSEAFYFATEARPYALLLGTLGLALLGYDVVLRGGGRGGGHSGWPRVLLFAGISGMLLTHVFALFVVLAFLMAEALRTLRLRRADPATWLALLLPLGLCVLYRPLLQGHGVMIYPPITRVALMPALRLYIYLFLVPIARVLAASLIVLLLYRSYPQTSFVRWIKMPPEEWLLLLAILATPVTVALTLMAKDPQSGFFARYGIPLLYPGLFFVVTWIAWRCRDSVAIARTLTLFALVGIACTYRDAPRQARHLMHRGWLAAPDEAASTGGVEKVHPELPLVANDGLEFLEADNRLSFADLKRFYYLTDTPTALRLSQSNVVEYLPTLRVPFHIRANFATLGDFTAQHNDFLVIGEIDRSTSWLMTWAQEQHADIRYLGDYAYAGRTMPLWRVTLKPI